MTHLSGSVTVVSAAVGLTLWIFAWYRMWKFDRFQCLNICARGRKAKRGGFLRAMTWSYLLGIPLYLVYFVGLSIIKYNEGFLTIPSLDTQLPMPHQLWPAKYRRLITPLYYCFAVSNSLSGITMVEDLCFWIYMLKRDAAGNSWMSSWEFRSFSILALIQTGALLAAVPLGQGDGNRIEGVLFLVVGATQGLVCLCFTWVIWVFPEFLKDALQAGIPKSVYQRLKTFHELNVFRTVFRIVYVISVTIPAIAGFADHDLTSHINVKLFWTDLWPITGLIGWSVSAATTIMIFFPMASDRDDDRLFSSVNASNPSQTGSASRSRNATISASSSASPKTPENKSVANFSRPLVLSSSPPDPSKSQEALDEPMSPTPPKRQTQQQQHHHHVTINDIPMETLGEDRAHRARQDSVGASTAREGSTYTTQTSVRMLEPPSRRRGAIRSAIRSYRTPLEVPVESEDEEVFDDDSDLVPRNSA